MDAMCRGVSPRILRLIVLACIDVGVAGGVWPPDIGLVGLCELTGIRFSSGTVGMYEIHHIQHTYKMLKLQSYYETSSSTVCGILY